jgi:hypothetical protein
VTLSLSLVVTTLTLASQTLETTETLQAPPAAAPPGAHEAALLYAPPGCLDRSTSRFDLKHKLAMSGAKDFRFVDVTLGAFSRGGRLLFPMKDDGDPSDVRAFLANAVQVERSNARAVRVAVTPWELAWSADAPDELVKLVDTMPKGTAAWRDASLVTLTAGANSVRAIELDANEPLETNVSAWVRQPLASEALGDRVLYFAGRRAGTAASIASALSSLGAAPLLLAGGLDAQHADCVARVQAAGAVAIGVRAEELALGPVDLRAIALPFVAANLRDAGGQRVLKPYVIVDNNIAVIGLVDPNALKAVAADVAATWSVGSAAAALEETVDAVRARESVHAIVVLAPSDALAAELSSVRGVDIVIGDFGSLELRGVQEVALRTQLSGDDRPGAPLLSVRGSAVSVGRLKLVTSQGRAVAVTHDTAPAAPHPFAPTDAAATVVDPYFERAAPNAGTAFPDLGVVVARAPDALRPMIYGDVIVRGRARHIADNEPARFSDPLWGRFVARIARDALGADLGVVRNMQRRDDIAGPLTRPVVEGWIPPGERVRVVEVKGDKLSKLVDTLRVQRGVAPSDLLFTTGLSIDGKTALVRGRAIENIRVYKVAISESALALAAVSAALTAPAGESRTLRELVLPRVLAESENVDVLADLLIDDADVKPAMWSVRVDDLSASGSGYSNAPGIARFATSRETRAATPNLLNLMLNADVCLPYDTNGFAWENRARLSYAALSVFAVPDAPPLVQEQLDDIVLSSEVRVGPYIASLFPFARVAFDTEHTALVVRTPDPVTLPHQLLLQESVGVALRPVGSWVKDARVGVIVQQDASAGLHHDAGLVAGASLAFPIGAALLTSETEARYLVPDGDDRFEDLGIRLRNVERLKVPVTDELAVFMFVDMFGLTSKSFDAVSGSVIVGAGLSFARVFPL